MLTSPLWKAIVGILTAGQHGELLVVTAMRTLDSLVTALGPASSEVQPMVLERCMSLLGDPSASVRLSAALCLAALATALPSQLYGLLKFCLKVVDDHRDNGIRQDWPDPNPNLPQP